MRTEDSSSCFIVDILSLQKQTLRLREDVISWDLPRLSLLSLLTITRRTRGGRLPWKEHIDVVYSLVKALTAGSLPEVTTVCITCRFEVIWLNTSCTYKHLLTGEKVLGIVKTKKKGNDNAVKYDGRELKVKLAGLLHK